MPTSRRHYKPSQKQLGRSFVVAQEGMITQRILPELAEVHILLSHFVFSIRRLEGLNFSSVDILISLFEQINLSSQHVGCHSRFPLNCQRNQFLETLIVLFQLLDVIEHYTQEVGHLLKEDYRSLGADAGSHVF